MSWRPVPGLRLAAGRAGFYADDRPDTAVLELAPETELAAVFTRNRFRAAPVEVACEHLAAARPRLLLVNAGCANAGLGAAGVADARKSCGIAARAFGLRAEEVLPFSTGVIGERLDPERFGTLLPELAGRLREDAWPEVAAAMLTTDTRIKLHGRAVSVGGREVRVTGMAKGAGMICPDMATMLAFVATDLAAPRELLEHALERLLPTSFHAVTVDGDTSTNDACALLATGASGVALAELPEAEIEAWQAAAGEVFEALAQDLVRDAEGATKFITVAVEGAPSPAEAHAVARAIAHSPLVKTAAFAGDPNWGRILAAVGRSVSAAVALERVGLWLDAAPVVAGGAVAADYREERARAVMARPEFTIRVDLAAGEASARLHTSDLSPGYVKINAEYRT